MEIREWFTKSLSQWGIELNVKQLEQFDAYYKLLIERNKQVNLTRITEVKDVFGKHFVDSLSLLKLEDIRKKETLIDVGTGAGFPSIPLKIALPHLRVILLDSLRKRLSFLEEVVDTVQLEGVTFIHGRVEDVAHEKLHREAYDIATARAVAGLNVLSEYCLPLVKVGGLFIAMKGSRAEEELCMGTKAIRELGGGNIRLESYALPDAMGERSLIIIQKKKSTPKMYPRKAGIPQKKPL